MKYNDFLKGMRMMHIKGFVINPYGCNLVIGDSQIETINSESAKISAGEKIAVGKTKEMPVDLLKVLSDFFAKTKYVQQAFLLWMVRNNECSYLLVLDAENEVKTLFKSISDISHDYLNGFFLDIVMADTSFGRSVIENQLHFYKS